jgi:uncharacterized protein
MRTISIDAARRIALGAQGFNDPRPKGRADVRHFRRVMNRLGVIQLDSVNVCVRSHYMPFYSRLGPYDRGALDTWLNDSGENFEYWAHVAAVLPVDRYPLWQWKMAGPIGWRTAEALIEAHPQLLEEVYEQVRDNGPLTISDLDVPEERTSPWWGYGPGKIALEALFAQGRITALRTGNFMRSYDIPERAIPVSHRPEVPLSEHEAYRALLLDAIRHLGIGTMHDVADYFRLKIPTARPIMTELVESGLIDEVNVRDWNGPVYLDPGASRPRSLDATTLLTPFDPVVWYRERGERLFNFHYRIEIYVPEPDRVFGYYSLPFMLDGDLVGRVDLKANRKTGTLLVQSSWREEGKDPLHVARGLSAELQRFAAWLDLGDIRVVDRGNLAQLLAGML